MQLKYCFKKEWSQFSRTFRLFAVILVFVLTSVSYPLLFGMINLLFQNTTDIPGTEQTAAIMISEIEQSPSDILGPIDMIEELMSSGLIFAATMSTVLQTGSIVTMLLLMSAAGGEQKKRAMIVPMCSGLSYKNYLIPKFIIYPLSIFAITFLTTFGTALLCNGMFQNGTMPFKNIMIMSTLAAVYVVFLTTIHLSLGLCTSHPGIMVAVIYIGDMIVESLLQGYGLVRFHPFAISSLILNIAIDPEFSLADEALNIAVSIAIAIVVCVIMFFLALAVLSAKKINNREEVKPEF